MGRGHSLSVLGSLAVPVTGLWEEKVCWYCWSPPPISKAGVTHGVRWASAGFVGWELVVGLHRSSRGPDMAC